MARNPWAHGMRRRHGPACKAEVCGVGSTRKPHGTRRGEAGGARRAQARRIMRMEMTQVRGGAQ
jgi:hypothetical protein